MRTTLKVFAALAAVAALAIGAALWTNWPRQSGSVAAQPRTDDRAGVDDLEKLTTLKVFFGHQSVGANVLEGVPGVYAQAGVAAPRILDVSSGELSSDVGPGTILHSYIGVNGDPQGKLTDFAAKLRSGLGSQIDVAVLKFCYVDITAGTDVDTLFASYRSTMAVLEEEFPRVAFVYATAPLTTETGAKQSVKNMLGRVSDNVARERYNALVRAAYGDSGRLFDIAAVESTEPDGTRVSRSVDGAVHFALYDGYASDEGHLDGEGATRAASEFLAVAARAVGSVG